MNLLIVPYGIETSAQVLLFAHACLLLIVPYGIETLKKKRQTLLRVAFNRTLWN